jgi:hypothetical protein
MRPKSLSHHRMSSRPSGAPFFSTQSSSQLSWCIHRRRAARIATRCGWRQSGR